MNYSDDIAVLFDSDNPGIELITYTPQGGTAKQIYAYVTRGPIDVAAVGGRPIAQDEIEIELAHDSTLGILVPKERFDRVTIKDNLGGTVDRVYTVSKIMKQDAISKVVRCTA